MEGVHQELYGAAAAAVLAVHLLWLLFIIFGVLLTANRRVLTAIHIVGLAWGIAVEVGPWPCPLTSLEQDLQRAAGTEVYSQSFIAHYLDRLVYPDIPEGALVIAGVSVCVFNLGVYGYRFISSVAGRSSLRA